MPGSPSHNAPVDCQSTQSQEGAAVACGGDCTVATVVPESLPAVPYVTVEMCLVMGGMDTEGEMFDDTLVMLLEDTCTGVAVNGESMREGTER